MLKQETHLVSKVFNSVFLLGYVRPVNKYLAAVGRVDPAYAAIKIIAITASETVPNFC